MIRGVDRTTSGSIVRLTWRLMSMPRSAMTATAWGVAGAPPGNSPAEPMSARAPLSVRSVRNMPSAMGERHWLAVQIRRTSILGV
jgi:hypothetical protein